MKNICKIFVNDWRRIRQTEPETINVMVAETSTITETEATASPKKDAEVV